MFDKVEQLLKDLIAEIRKVVVAQLTNTEEIKKLRADFNAVHGRKVS